MARVGCAHRSEYVRDIRRVLVSRVNRADAFRNKVVPPLMTRAIRDWRPCKPSFATSRGENQLWLLSAALSWLFPRRRRFVLYLLRSEEHTSELQSLRHL